MRGEVGRGVPVRAAEQLADAARAPVAEPVAAEEDREVGRRDAVVGIDQPAARRRDDVRQLLAGGPAGPVVRAVARHRRRAVAGAADRHAAGDNSAMRSRSATSRFCTGAVIRAAALPAASTSPRLVQREQAGGGGVAGRQVGHRHRQDRAAAVAQVADHRAMAGLAHRQHLVRLAAHLDALLAQGEGARAVRASGTGRRPPASR